MFTNVNNCKWLICELIVFTKSSILQNTTYCYSKHEMANVYYLKNLFSKVHNKNNKSNLHDRACATICNGILNIHACNQGIGIMGSEGNEGVQV